MSRPTKILVVDREEAVLRAVAQILTRDGHEVVALGGRTEGLAGSRDLSVEVALLDLGGPDQSGRDDLAALQRARPELEVIVLTAASNVAAAVEAVRAGASDYLTKPFENLEEISLTVAKAIERKALRERMRLLETGLSSDEGLAHLPYAQAKRIAVRAFERRYLTALLEHTKFNISSAARAAGVDRSNFRRLLKQYEVARGKLANDAGEPGDGTPGSDQAGGAAA